MAVRHDYELPPDWNAMTPDERDAWFHQERARRQAMNQKTPFARRVEQEREQLERRQNRRVDERLE